MQDDFVEKCQQAMLCRVAAYLGVDSGQYR